MILSDERMLMLLEVVKRAPLSTHGARNIRKFVPAPLSVRWWCTLNSKPVAKLMRIVVNKCGKSQNMSNESICFFFMQITAISKRNLFMTMLKHSGCTIDKSKFKKRLRL